MHLLHIERCSKDDVPLDQLLRLLHFRIERWVTHEFRRILDLAASLVEASYNSNDGPFHHVRQVCDAVEGHAPGPLVNNFNEVEPGLASKIIGVLAGEDNLVLDLEIVHFVRNRNDCFLALFQTWGQGRGVFGFFLKDERRQQRDYLFWLVLCQDVFKNKLCQDQLVCRMDLETNIS